MSRASNYQDGRPDVIQSTTGGFQRTGTEQSQKEEWKDKYKEMNKAMLLEKLVQVTKYKDKKRLEKSIKDYQESGMSTADCEELEDAEKLLNILTTKEALIEATTKKDETDIQMLLSSIDKNEKEVKKKFKEKKKKFRVEDGCKHHLSYEMAEARKVMRVVASGRNKNRQRMPRLMGMNRNTMSEVKRYTNPPAVLHKVMQASLLLLGEDENTTQDWRKCAAMANPDGRQGMNRRMQTLDVDGIKPEICARAKQILDGLEYRTLLLASAGGATFYVWAMGTVDDYLKTHSLDGIAPATPEQQKRLLGIPTEDPLFIPKINKHKGQAKVNSTGNVEPKVRATHSAETAKESLVELKH